MKKSIVFKLIYIVIISIIFVILKNILFGTDTIYIADYMPPTNENSDLFFLKAAKTSLMYVMPFLVLNLISVLLIRLKYKDMGKISMCIMWIIPVFIVYILLYFQMGCTF